MQNLILKEAKKEIKKQIKMGNALLYVRFFISVMYPSVKSEEIEEFIIEILKKNERNKI